MTSPSSARDDASGAASPILVLVNPQDIVNIASAVRIAKNFGIEHMRLVNPEVFDPWRIEGIAHNTADFVARIEILPSLEAALADCVSAYVLTGRERAAKRPTPRPREAAAELVRELEVGPGGDRRGPRGQRAHQRRARSLPHGRHHRDRSAPSVAQPGAGRGHHGLRDLERAGWRGAAAQAAPARGRAGHVRAARGRSSPTGTGRSGPSTSSRPADRRA